jgi:hypothetical protein
MIEDLAPVRGVGPLAHHEEMAQLEVAVIVKQELLVLIKGQIDQVVLGVVVPCRLDQDVEAVQIAVNVADHGPLLVPLALLRRRRRKGQGIGIPVPLGDEALFVRRDPAIFPEEAVETAFVGVEPVAEPASQEVLRRAQFQSSSRPRDSSCTIFS